MLRDLYKYMCVSLAALLAAACADLPETTEVPDPQEPRYMTFDISEIDTKVSDSEDLKSYEFSIWIFEPDKKSDPLSDPLLVDGDNVKLRYDSASRRWRFHNGSSFIDVPWGNGKHDFFVVSSYDLAGTSEKISFDKSAMGYMSSYQNSMARFVVPAMNMTYTDGSDYNYYKDILYAAASRDVRTEDGYKPVSLTLGHLWPALEFNMINETDQNKYITDFSVSNFRVNSNTTIEFSASSGYNTTPPSNNSDDFAANKYEVADFVLGPGEQRSVFGMPVMVFPQKFVSNVNSAILSFSVDGVKTTKSFFVVGSDGLSTQEWNPGTLYSYDISLTTAAEPVVISPTASIEHKDPSGVLTHSALTLNLPLDEAKLKRVKDLTVVVSKGGETYLNQTFATVSSNQITLYKGSPSDPGRFYMPQGDYQVTLTYNDGFYDQEVTCQATSPAPDYTLTVNVSATSNQFTVNSMSVNIADRVLAECPLKGEPSWDFIFRVTGNPGYKYIYTSDGGVSLNSSNIVSNVTFSSWAPQNSGYYTIFPYVKFDDVEKKAANCNIVTSNNYSGQYIYPNEVRYRTVSQIYDSRNLEDGAMYVIKANWTSSPNSLYWSVNTSTGQLVSGSDETSFPKEYVFVYDRDASKEVAGGFKDTNPSNYRLESVGAWKSLATGDYMVYSNGLFYFNESSASDAQYVVCANGWDTYNTSADIDMCVDATRMIVYTNNAFTLGTNSTPNQQWKWNIFKVEEE